MTTSPIMQAFITDLAEQHEFPLSGPEAVSSRSGPLVIEMEQFPPIIVEVTAPNRVTVSTYSDGLWGDMMIGGKTTDLEQNKPNTIAKFSTGNAEWVLIAVEGDGNYFDQMLFRHGTDPLFVQKLFTDTEYLQEAAAEEFEQIARQWEEQGWLQRGQRRAIQQGLAQAAG